MLIQTTAPLVSKMYIFGKCKNVRFTLCRSMRPYLYIRLYHFFTKEVNFAYSKMSLSTGLDLEFDLIS